MEPAILAVIITFSILGGIGVGVWCTCVCLHYQAHKMIGQSL